MENGLEVMLRSILKEELQPVNNRLDKIDGRLDGLETRMGGMENRMDGLQIRMDGLEVLTLEIKEGQERMQKNIIMCIGDYNENIIHFIDDKTDALNKRVFSVETEIQRLNKQ
ncbi:hypothetical protein [Bacillus sp. B-jedd]|uniref:hypothetical protein n=1 Tax=Bacillus sp. B-jedd TaxID=1476857 RepID=UPI0005157147|nr:hypothetical protein [Bacillus sp. B-jedd]CEG27067.1 hypothetical protein BN1002_01923 [Bacillus sp. B-jedd]